MKAIEKYLDKDELLSKLGLETKPSTTAYVAGLLGPFGVGMLVGAGIALLLTPKSGRELREDIRSKLRRPDEDEPSENGINVRSV